MKAGFCKKIADIQITYAILRPVPLKQAVTRAAHKTQFSGY
jgi:hypothetical protein